MYGRKSGGPLLKTPENPISGGFKSSKQKENEVM